jgi:hypothetical protein
LGVRDSRQNEKKRKKGRAKKKKWRERMDRTP